MKSLPPKNFANDDSLEEFRMMYIIVLVAKSLLIFRTLSSCKNTIMFQNITAGGACSPAQEKKILGYEVQSKERTIMS